MPSKPPTPEVQVEPQLGRWAAASNVRRVIEEGLTISAFLAAATLVAIGLRRLPAAATHVGIDLRPAQAGLEAAGVLFTAGVCVGIIVRAFVRYRRRRTDSGVLARRLDQRHETRDLFTTALAVERGQVHGNVGLEGVVTARARTVMPDMNAPIERFEAPAFAFASMGLAAALVALLPMSAAADADGTEDAAAAADVVQAPPLPEDVLEALRARAKSLERLEYTPGLKDEAREAIAQARKRLETLSEDPDRSLSELARAQKTLEDLERQAREQGLHDKEKLKSMNDAELAEQLAKSMQRGETDTAAEMAEEFSRRLDEASTAEQDRIARALERALRRNPETATDGKTAPSRAESEARARDRNRLDELAENLADGDTGSARAGLDNLADEMRERGGSESLEDSLGDAAEEIRKARERQLDEMNGEGEGQGEGEGEGEGEGGAGQGQPPGGSPGAGEGEGEGEGKGKAPGGKSPWGKEGGKAPGMASPMGPPGGKPGPGGGVGKTDTKGSVQPSTDASGLAPQRVDARPRGPAQGSVRAIRRYSEGYRDTREYKDLHDKYSAVAESAVRREEIPLTRRDYIRSYFQAVRGR